MRPTATHYALGTPPVTGVGLGVSRDRLDEALGGPVAAVGFDDAGTDEIAALLDGLVDTGQRRPPTLVVLDHGEVPRFPATLSAGSNPPRGLTFMRLTAND